MIGSKNKTVFVFDGKLFLILFLLIGGIAIRFYIQFVEWSFNGDEVELGLGVVNNDFSHLFSPLSNRQSAPPLFLLLQKLVTPIAKPYISLKIVSFLASCFSLLLFNRILRNRFPFFLHIILLGVFCFNPFIISNSLTLKQYSLDLLLGLVAVNYFISNRSAYKTFGFFSIFCLFSNVGPFFCVSFSLFLFLQDVSQNKDLRYRKALKRISPYLLSPVPYLLFFIWFLRQPGAENMKDYMVGYWSTAFMPLDFTIFKWMAVQAKVIMIFFFSTYWFIGFPLLLLFLQGIYFFFKNKYEVFQNELLSFIFIYVISGLVHLLLSALKMYPFSDRLFLYLAPGVYLILGYGIISFYKQIKTWWHRKIVFYSSLFILLSNIVLYFTYMPKKTNDVPALMNFLDSTEHPVSLTPNAKNTSLKWLDFTQYNSLDPDRLINASTFSVNNYSQHDFVIAVQSQKFGHKKKLTTPEPILEQLLAQKKILFYHRVGGYAIYKVK